MKRLLMLLFTSSSLFAGFPPSQAAEVLTVTGDEQPEQVTTENQPTISTRKSAFRFSSVTMLPQLSSSPRLPLGGMRLQLQAAIKSGTRSSQTPPQITPLDQQYAIASLPAGTRMGASGLQARIALSNLTSAATDLSSYSSSSLHSSPSLQVSRSA